MARVLMGLLVVSMLVVAVHGSTIDEARGKASGAMQGAKEKTAAWSQWVQDKVSGGLGLGLKHKNVMAAADDTADIAVNAKDSASGAAETTSEKAGESKDTIKDKAEKSAECMSGKTEDVKGKTAESAGKASENAGGFYENAKQKMEEAYAAAKEKMTENSKASYEAAKEKVSQATGDKAAAERTEEL